MQDWSQQVPEACRFALMGMDESFAKKYQLLLHSVMLENSNCFLSQFKYGFIN